MTLVSEAMNRSVVSVAPEARATEAAALARRARADHLLVLDAGNLVGILCSVCDLEGVEPGEEVAERMSVPVLTIRPDATIEDAAVTLTECEVGCLPVACGGLILGTVCVAELERAGVRAPRARRCHH
jgi:acetoin utilization protein AcuB